MNLPYARDVSNALRSLPDKATDGLRRSRRTLQRVRTSLLAPLVVTIGDGPARGMRIAMRYASNEYRTGTVEMPVQRAIASLVSPGCVFFDIGANVGFFTMVAYAATGGEGTFVAFEPRADVATQLAANLARNDVPAQVWPVAVGEQQGIAPLFVARHPGGATIEPSKSADVQRIEHVPQFAIDDLVESSRLPLPDVVKIDVEGAEPAVLRGMTRTLGLHRTTVVFEVDAPTEDEAEGQYREVDRMLTDLGYTSERLDAGYPDSQWHVLHAVARPGRSA